MSFDHIKIEEKWRNYWLENKTFKTDAQSDKKKFYALDMFPYPSGVACWPPGRIHGNRYIIKNEKNARI